MGPDRAGRGHRGQCRRADRRRGNHRHGHAPRPASPGRARVGRGRRPAGLRERRRHLARRRPEIRAGRELQRRRRAGAGLDHDARRRQHLLDAVGRHLPRRHSVRLGHRVRRGRELRAGLAARQRRAHRSDQGSAGHAVRRSLDGRLVALHHQGAVAERVRRPLLHRSVRYRARRFQSAVQGRRRRADHQRQAGAGRQRFLSGCRRLHRPGEPPGGRRQRRGAERRPGDAAVQADRRVQGQAQLPGSEVRVRRRQRRAVQSHDRPAAVRQVQAEHRSRRPADRDRIRAHVGRRSSIRRTGRPPRSRAATRSSRRPRSST